MPADTDFDARAESWDEDPGKHRRASAVAEAICAAVPVAPSWKALEYGAGTGLLSFALNHLLADITLADSSRGMLDVATRKVAASGNPHMRVIALDLTRDPLPGDRFDLIYSMMTLHHIPDTRAVLAAFADMLNPGGWLALADLDAEDGSFHGLGADVHHGFDRAQLREQMRGAGFTDISIETCFEISRGSRAYPVFLAVGARS